METNNLHMKNTHHLLIHHISVYSIILTVILKCWFAIWQIIFTFGDFVVYKVAYLWYNEAVTHHIMKTKIDTFLAHMNSLPNAAEGFAPIVLHQTGNKFGLTCVQVRHLFLGKGRALTPGKYPAKVADGVEIPIAKLVKTPKSSKSTRVVLNVKVPKAAKKAAKTIQVISNAAPAEDTSEFMFIATPEELAEA
jgi:hypothetical protein